MSGNAVKLNSRALDALAIYFTGPDVVRHSIALQLPLRDAYNQAHRFFEARGALGIRGYPNVFEATQSTTKR